MDRKALSRLVERYDAESRLWHFGCLQQPICMAFAQLTWREGLRDIAECLNVRPATLYHLGFSKVVAMSTLADANEQREWRFWGDLANALIPNDRPLHAGEDFGLDIDNTVYALACPGFASPYGLPSAGYVLPVGLTTVALSLTLLPWADFRKIKAGIKMHTQIEVRGPISNSIFVSAAREHDVRWLDDLVYEPGAFCVMDHGYMDFARLHLIAQAGAFFFTRAKDNLQYARQRSQTVDMRTGRRSEQIGKTMLPKARADFPSLLRKVRFYDQKEGLDFVFLTNNLTIPTLTVATLYRLRWRIELVFRWIKGHLRIKH